MATLAGKVERQRRGTRPRGQVDTDKRLVGGEELAEAFNPRRFRQRKKLGLCSKWRWQYSVMLSEDSR
jgi:hypothetical protein